MTGLVSKRKRLEFECSRAGGDGSRDVTSTAELILSKDSDSHCDCCWCRSGKGCDGWPSSRNVSYGSEVE